MGKDRNLTPDDVLMNAVVSTPRWGMLALLVAIGVLLVAGVVVSIVFLVNRFL